MIKGHDGYRQVVHQRLIQVSALDQHVLRVFALRQIDAQTGHVRGQARRIEGQYVGPGDGVTRAAFIEHLIFVHGIGQAVTAGHGRSEKAAGGFAGVRGDEHFEPVPAKHFFLRPPGELEKMFVGEGDPALGVEGDADLGRVQQDVSPFFSELAKASRSWASCRKRV